MPTAPPPDPPAFPSRAEAFRFWLRLGFVSFGGPAGQIAVMHEELVERRRWISEGRFLHALNYCMLLPGPEAQQLATYIGWLMHRTWGGLVAGGLFVLPSLLILVGLSWVAMAFGTVPAVAGLFYGIKPAVTALVVQAALRIGSRALTNAWLRAIAVAAFAAIFALQVPFPLIVLAAGLAGHVGGRFAPAQFRSGAAAHAAGRSGAPALLDDHAPTPPHARFSRSRLWRVVLVFALTWSAAIAGLAAACGRDAVLPRMAWFFTKAALLTFGGAYAVLPYVYQGAVDAFHWVTPAQMMDGLALGETTPGPLIMVVAYVGFVGAWTRAVLGADALLAGGAAGAAVATFFTFLPSFFFILAGAPFIETTHGRIGFTAPLVAITAAVVGVIANLAVFFAYHVLWPRGPAGGFDPAAALIGVAAGVALLRWRLGVIPVVLGTGLAGLLGRLAGVL